MPDDRAPSRLPALGRRGGGWVLGQVVLVAAVFLSALAGHGWSGGYRFAAYVCGGVLLGAGGLLLAAGGVGLGSALTPLPAPSADHELVTSGVYSLVRHPMYGGGLLIALGWSIVFATLIGLAVTLLLAIFLRLKARREELWLVDRFAGYNAYRRRTRRSFVPFVW